MHLYTIVIRMVSKEELLQKHQPLTKKGVKDAFKEQEEIKKKYTMDAAILEKNLEKFNEILDPMVDPTTDTALCWIRRPTQEELEMMIPADLLKYRGKPEEIPADKIKEGEDLLFEMMAQLIAVPEHTAKEWKARANMVFQRLFQLHIQQVFDDLGMAVGNF